MKKNIGNVDRVVRFIIAFALFGVLASKLTFGLFSYVILAATAIIVVTAMVGSCPLYNRFSLSTKVNKTRT